MKLTHPFKFLMSATLLAGLAACGGGGGDSAAANGTLRLAMTDAPSCGYDAVHVTVSKVRVHQSSTVGDADPGWSEVVLNPARRVDLLSLTNGVLVELGETPLPTGKYTQMRLVLAENSAAQPLANAVTPTGSSEVALKMPSGQQSGVKTKINIDIAENQMADFVLDFDACKSVVTAGASGQYLLKPVVTVIPRYVSGVQGHVDPAIGAGVTHVSLQLNGTTIKATVPDSTGKFLLQPVAPGNYTLVMAAPGRTTAVVTDVPVAAQTVTPLTSVASPIALPASAIAGVAGVAAADTFMRTLQPLASGAVEIDSKYVDSVTGAYAFTLPVAAPLVAAYAAAPAPLVFAPYAAAAGQYTVRAGLPGFADKDAVLAPLAAGDTVSANFTFP